MNTNYKNNILVFSLTLLVFTSCKVAQNYRSPQINTNGLFRDAITTDTTSIAKLHWNEIFTDTILQNLIAEGIAQNLDLKVAYTRIQQSQAYFEQSKAAFYPTLSANASSSVSKLPDAQRAGTISSTKQYQLYLNSSWEAGLWGKLSSTRKANLASLLQNEAFSRIVQTNLVANIANYYFLLLALDRQLAITQQTVQNRMATVETMKALKEGAVVTGAAIVQSEASQYAAEVTIPDLKQNIRETENALSIILGRSPDSIIRSSLDTLKPIAVLQVGVPAQLLSNRPDVQQAEFNFRYNFELTNVARTYFYPSLTISAAGGLTSSILSNFLNAGSFFANLTGGLTQPLFNRRSNITRLKVSQAQQKEALLSFQNTLLTAGQEVSNAMSFYETAQEKIIVRSNQLSALEKSVEYSQELLRSGFANYTEVLNAQQNLLSARLSGVNDHLQQLQAVVNLYRALGGGWR